MINCPACNGKSFPSMVCPVCEGSGFFVRPFFTSNIFIQGRDLDSSLWVFNVKMPVEDRNPLRILKVLPEEDLVINTAQGNKPILLDRKKVEEALEYLRRTIDIRDYCYWVRHSCFILRLTSSVNHQERSYLVSDIHYD